MNNRKQHVIIQLLGREMKGGKKQIHSKPHKPQGRPASAETSSVPLTS